MDRYINVDEHQYIYIYSNGKMHYDRLELYNEDVPYNCWCFRRRKIYIIFKLSVVFFLNMFKYA